MRIAAIPSRALWVVALVCWPPAVAPSWAHESPAASVHDLGPPAVSVGEAVLLAALAAVVALGLGRRRRFALALAVVLPFLGFEAGLHSIHHLDGP